MAAGSCYVRRGHLLLPGYAVCEHTSSQRQVTGLQCVQAGLLWFVPLRGPAGISRLWFCVVDHLAGCWEAAATVLEVQLCLTCKTHLRHAANQLQQNWRFCCLLDVQNCVCNQKEPGFLKASSC